MTDEQFQAGLTQVRTKISGLPPDKQGRLLTLVDEAVRRHSAVRHNCGRARDGLADLTIVLKYIVFDNEATLRELAQSRRSDGD